MKSAISKKVWDQLEYGKYTRWSQKITIESLALTLWVVGVFGKEYNGYQCSTGRKPNPVFAPHNMSEERMRRALETIALIQGGGDVAEPQSMAFAGNTQPAFVEHFRERLSNGGPYEKWAGNLQDRQFWTLLWHIGEYGIRVRGEPPTFGMPRLNENIVRKSLRILVDLHDGKTIDLETARKWVFDEQDG